VGVVDVAVLAHDLHGVAAEWFVRNLGVLPRRARQGDDQEEPEQKKQEAGVQKDHRRVTGRPARNAACGRVGQLVSEDQRDEERCGEERGRGRLDPARRLASEHKDRWIRFLDVPAIAGGLLSQGSWREFDPAHLWFLYVLVLWSIVLLPLFLYLRRPARKGLVDRAAGLAERNLAVVLFGAAVPIMLVEAVLGPDVDTGGWERLAYLFFLLYGYVIASDARFEGVLRRARRFGLALALVATVALLIWVAALSDSTAFQNGGVPGLSTLQALAGWLWIVAILGFARSFVAGRSGRPATRLGSQLAGSERRAQRTARYANEAVLPFYVLHEPVIVAAAWIIIRWDVPIVVKYAALVIVSLVGTLALYEGLVRRFRVSRFLLGMKVAR
jgi:hypothetical protein